MPTSVTRLRKADNLAAETPTKRLFTICVFNRDEEPTKDYDIMVCYEPVSYTHLTLPTKA